MAIRVTDHDPSWAERAATACDDVTAALPGVFDAIEHIGSTAVPGLAANPSST
ncbi:GrpB protein [Haloactinopolyspora alba]|uniref:GrpB protein n=1 Tax=Haloactinopolyspora alba TaxID=648780 RepID=A0A2P8EB99_9ACTN|nr:GrpB family protein [Haloactinopolyspora alba]PSL06745.1 GrpB protein [Haloactinopolyspora alba]